MLSIRVDSISQHESFPLLSIRHAGNRFARDLQDIAPWTMQGGLKMLSGDSSRFDRIDSNCFPCCHSSCRRSICAIRYSVRIESNRKLPQTNRLSLDVLDMDVCSNYYTLLFINAVYLFSEGKFTSNSFLFTTELGSRIFQLTCLC